MGAPQASKQASKQSKQAHHHRQGSNASKEASKQTTSRDSKPPKVNSDALTNKLLFCILQYVALVECGEEAIVGMRTSVGPLRINLGRASQPVRDYPLKCISGCFTISAKASVLQPLLLELCILTPLWIVALPISVASFKHFEPVQIGWHWHHLDAMR